MAAPSVAGPDRSPLEAKRPGLADRGAHHAELIYSATTRSPVPAEGMHIQPAIPMRLAARRSSIDVSMAATLGFKSIQGQAMIDRIDELIEPTAAQCLPMGPVGIGRSRRARPA